MQQLSAGTSSRQHERRANVPERRAKARGRDPVDLLMGVLDEIDYGLILVDESARVRFANQVALNECACGLVVRVQEGVFTPRDAGDQKALQKALWAARRGCRSLLRLSGGGATHTVAVVPLDPSSGLATLLVFGKRQICEPLSLDFFARTHQLSLAESTVLRRLCDGSLPEQIAQEKRGRNFHHTDADLQRSVQDRHAQHFGADRPPDDSSTDGIDAASPGHVRHARNRSRGSLNSPGRAGTRPVGSAPAAGYARSNARCRASARRRVAAGIRRC